MSVFPHGTSPRAAVIPVGDPAPAACEAVAEALGETFELSVPVRAAIDPPRDEASVADANRYLEFLATETDGIDLAVAVTDRRIGLRPDRVPLFGVGREFGTVGVVSTARLLEGADPSALERERLAKEARSVAGTMLGVRTQYHHEADGRPCVVAPGNARYQLDEAPSTYCEDCWDALTGASSSLEPPRPDDWAVARREVGGEEDEFQWWQYLLAPIGFALLAVIRIVGLLQPVADRVPRPGTGSVRDLPQPVHTLYRIVRFWTNVALYLGAIVCWLYVSVSIHDRLFGTEFSDAGIVALLIACVLAGVFTGWMIKGILGGIVDGLRLIAAEEWD